MMSDFREKVIEHIAINAVSTRKLYVYSHPGVPKDIGFVKIGETDQKSVYERVRQDHLTNEVEFEILGEYLGVDANNNIVSDKDIHAILRQMGYNPRKKSDSDRSGEWFEIEFEKADRLIKDRLNLTGSYEYLRREKGTYKLREAQEQAVQKTLNRYNAVKSHAGSQAIDNKFLWWAKPRFGKTLTAYDFALRAGMKKVLIITGRTAISQSWTDDYFEFFHKKSDFFFGSSKENIAKTGESALNKTQTREFLRQGKSVIFFVSWADIKGEDREAGDKFKAANQWIFDTNWDLVVIDEVHESAKTELAYKVFDGLNYDFRLELSGTAFKNEQEYSDANMFVWSYEDEQFEKEHWDFSKGPNPYAEMPRMNIFSFEIDSTVRNSIKVEDSSFKFPIFFQNDGLKFVNEKAVDDFLDLLCREVEVGDSPERQFYPFADKDTRETLRHTFWLMPHGSTQAMNLLRDKLESHWFFGKEGENYQVIVASGDATESSAAAEQELKDKITDKPWKTKTITLSQQMLTTGTTVKPWTAVLMLDDSNSKERYFQTVFRAQSPWDYKDDDGVTHFKQNAYVFDFSPARTLGVIEEYAEKTFTKKDKKVITSDEKVEAIMRVLNFMPFISMDENREMRMVEAKELLSMGRSVAAREIFEGGFMSQKIFNIKGVFRDSKKTRALIDLTRGKTAIDMSKAKTNKQATEYENSIKAKIGDNGEIVISDNSLGEPQIEYTYIDKTTGQEVSLAADILEDGQLPESIKEEVQKNSDGKVVSTILKDIQREINAKEKNRKKVEKEQSDKLRRLTVAFPLLLLAYGKPGMGLRDIATSKGISEEILRDATEYSHEEFNQLIELGVFKEIEVNTAIDLFIKEKKALGRYFEQGPHGKDIFSYILPQLDKNGKTTKVFTPKWAINKMLDDLERESPGIFKSPKVKFFDPNMKSGMFITEIAKRLYANSKDKNIYRILKEQLFGFAPNKLHAEIAREMILGFVKYDENLPKSEYYYKENFLEVDLIDEIKNPGRLQELIKEKFGGDVKFDVVIGNPPYQENDNGVRADGTSNASAKGIYHHFIMEAMKFSDKQCFIIPARWRAGAGKGTGDFAEMMLSSDKIRNMTVYIDSKDVFPNNDVKGGIAYFMRDKDYSGPVKLRTVDTNGEFEWSTTMNNTGSVGVLVPYEELASILAKVELKEDLAKRNFQDIVSPLKPYGLRTDFFKNQKKYGLPPIQNSRQKADDLEIFGLDKKVRTSRFAPSDYPLPRGQERLGKWKIFAPYAYGCGALGETIPSPILGSPIQICLETFLEIGPFDTEFEARAALKYYKSKFLRALVGVLKITQHGTTTYRAVPLQDFTDNSDIDWSKSIAEVDRQLYAKYGLSDREIAFIEEKVREME